MRFRLLTLIDITRTDSRRGDDVRSQKQQQNYLTALQTISLRSNPIVNSRPVSEVMNVKDLGFGKAFKGDHRVWKLNFEFESESHSLDFLKYDFDLVPVITDLDETIKLKNSAFLTNGNDERNIVFLNLDDSDQF